MNSRFIAALIALLIALEAAAFGALSAIHAGVPMFGIADPPTRTVAAVEAAGIVLFVLCLGAVLAKLRWARAAAFIAHGFAVAAVMMGMANLALAQTPRSVANDYLYRVVLLVSLLMLVFLLTPAARAALERGEPRRPPARTP